jgi:MoaA/NifB/PqqE/SkfB family radical SAM enzyme
VEILVKEYFPLPNFMPDFKQTNAARKVHCPMGEDNLYIFPDGEVCPCTFTHISFGNILEEPAEDILKRMDASHVLLSVARDGMCPISMDKEFIAKVHRAINSSHRYPPRADEVGF